MAEILQMPSRAVEAVTPYGSPPPDQAARDQALSPEHSFLVEAPAGSGKTGLLIQRYLRLLTTPQVTEPEQVLALTFTNKAAAEMRDRVLEQLRAATLGHPAGESGFDRTTRQLAEEVLARDRELGWNLLAESQRLNMRTIDSLCAQIVRSLPVLSRASGLASQPDAEPLYREAARRTLMRLGEPDGPLPGAITELLLHRDANLGDVLRLLTEMLPLREQWRSLIPEDLEQWTDADLDTKLRPAIEQALGNIVCALLSDVERAIPRDLLDRIAQLAEALAHRAGYDTDRSSMVACAGRHTAPLAEPDHLEHWLALRMLVMTKDGLRSPRGINGRNLKIDLALAKTKDPQRDALRSLVQDLQDHIDRDGIESAFQSLGDTPPAHYTEEQWQITRSLLRVLRQTLLELDAVFSEAGECDFAEQSYRTAEALREAGPEGLPAALGCDVQHLLVDEMQDTSLAQYKLLDLLTAGWAGTPRTVFLVGDPKQSIYIFRQARVERFLRILTDRSLNGIPLTTLALHANFRSQPALVTSFNQEFARLFPTSAPPSAEPERFQLAADAHFAAAAAMEQSRSPQGEGSVWKTRLLPYEAHAGLARERRKKRALEEAEAIRAALEVWRAKPLPQGRMKPWRAAILLRSRPQAGPILAALRRSTPDNPAIPYRGVELEALGERQEVLDLLAVTRALLHPADRVAWLALLRAPWAGLSLADLHALSGVTDLSDEAHDADAPDWRERTVEEALGERGDLLSAEGYERVLRLWPILRAAVAARGRLPLAETVERTWRSLGGPAYLDADQLQNAALYLRLLSEVELQAGEVNLPTLERRLGKLYSESAPNPLAVEVLTIHKSKGLEWDVVFIPALERPPRGDTPRLLDWMELDVMGSGVHALLAPIAGKGDAASALNRWVGNIRRQRDFAERKRLFYVASTRAREELHRFAFATRTKTGGISLGRASLLDAAFPAVEEHLLASEVQNVAVDPQDALRSSLEEQAELTLDLAASEEPGEATAQEPPPRWVLPIEYIEVPPAAEAATPPERSTFERPEGGFSDRAFGNAVHAFLDRVADELASGQTPTALLARLPDWRVAMESHLRAAGLGRSLRADLADRTLEALRLTLNDADGCWLLAPHPAAANEAAMVSYRDGQRTALRADRTFRAGATPQAAGDDHLWIIDYKTSTPATTPLEEFLEHEHEVYAPQLAAYAEAFGSSHPTEAIRLGLYFPLLQRLVWWAL